MSVGKGKISALAVGRRTASESTAGTGSDGSTITKIKQYTVSVNPGNLAAHSSEAVSVTVTGVSTDDVVISCEPQAALTAGIGIDYTRVSAANTVIVAVTNNTAGAVDQAAVNFKITCMRITAANQ